MQSEEEVQEIESDSEIVLPPQATVDALENEGSTTLAILEQIQLDLAAFQETQKDVKQLEEDLEQVKERQKISQAGWMFIFGF